MVLVGGNFRCGKMPHIVEMLRGNYASYGIARNFRTLQRVRQAVERYWRRTQSNWSWSGVIAGVHFQRMKEHYPLLRPKPHLPYRELQAVATL